MRSCCSNVVRFKQIKKRMNRHKHNIDIDITKVVHKTDCDGMDMFYERMRMTG